MSGTDLEEPWWPLEWQESMFSGFPYSQPYFHPTIGHIQNRVDRQQIILESRVTGRAEVVLQTSGNEAEDTIILRCALLELAYPGGNDDPA